jgi:hypothetical protein
MGVSTKNFFNKYRNSAFAGHYYSDNVRDQA